MVQRRVPRVAPTVLVGVVASVATVGLRRALPPSLVVPGQTLAAAAVGIIELQKLVEPAMSIEEQQFFRQRGQQQTDATEQVTTRSKLSCNTWSETVITKMMAQINRSYLFASVLLESGAVQMHVHGMRKQRQPKQQQYMRSYLVLFHPYCTPRFNLLVLTLQFITVH